jgi:hypothetical protein
MSDSQTLVPAETLLAGSDLPALGFSITERKIAEPATHVVLEKR